MPKFRTYLKDIKQIVDVDTIFFKNRVVKVSNNEFHHFDDLILMQSTGLYDKNSVEIFQGDIVKLQDELHLIKFEKYRFEADGFWMNWQDDPGDFFSEDAYKQCEVVGNIHQHHELLEDV